jgi:hypothetical protein
VPDKKEKFPYKMFPWRLEYPDPDTNYKTTKLCFFTCKEYALIHIERHKIKRKGRHLESAPGTVDKVSTKRPKRPK